MSHLFMCEYKAKNPIFGNTTLRFHTLPKNNGIVFFHKGMRYKPTLYNTQGSFFGKGSIKTFQGNSEKFYLGKQKKFSLTEHLLATLYSSGHHNIGVQIIGPNFPIFGVMPPQGVNRELDLFNLLVKYSPNPYDEYVILPEYKAKSEKFLFETSKKSQNNLKITTRVDLNGHDEKGIFNLNNFPEDSYSSISNSRPYSPFHSISNSYIKCKTFNEVTEACDHSIVDRLGAIALLANTLNKRIIGNLETWRSGHNTDIIHLNRIYEILTK